MTEANPWNEKIIKEILLHTDFFIAEVHGFEVIKSLFFDQDKYPSIASLIKNKRWEDIKRIDDENKYGFREYLDIIKFFHQNKLLHIATVYDSDELWQDPEIIDIFPMREAKP